MPKCSASKTAMVLKLGHVQFGSLVSGLIEIMRNTLGFEERFLMCQRCYKSAVMCI